MPIVQLKLRLVVSQLKKSLNSGSESHATPNMAVPPRPSSMAVCGSPTCLAQGSRLSPGFLPSTDSSRPVGTETSESRCESVCLCPHARPGSLPHHPCSQAALDVQTGKVPPEPILLLPCCFLNSFLLIPFPMGRENPFFLLRVLKTLLGKVWVLPTDLCSPHRVPPFEWLWTRSRTR